MRFGEAYLSFISFQFTFASCSDNISSISRFNVKIKSIYESLVILSTEIDLKECLLANWHRTIPKLMSVWAMIS